MDAGVGAAGRVQRMVRADDRGDFLFEDLLDAERIRLALPARVVGAVVRDRQLERSRHRVRTGPYAFAARDPGFTIGSPSLQSGQSSG